MGMEYQMIKILEDAKSVFVQMYEQCVKDADDNDYVGLILSASVLLLVVIFSPAWITLYSIFTFFGWILSLLFRSKAND